MTPQERREAYAEIRKALKPSPCLAVQEYFDSKRAYPCEICVCQASCRAYGVQQDRARTLLNTLEKGENR